MLQGKKLRIKIVRFKKKGKIIDQLNAHGTLDLKINKVHVRQ